MINILTPEVFNRIAAGEVVDRPYSVVKELLENAIDAGATEITIEIEAGGKRIRVIDNGCGIEKGDLKNAFLPHATSKLKYAEDLETVATLGFRGEAIASIASVSHMTITSKRKGEEGWSLTSDGGKMGQVLPAAAADGTSVSVNDLFFNTPARRKFLKSDTQEEADITNIIVRCMLLKPEISFTYLLNGKVRLRTLGDGLKNALAIVYGASTLENCFELDAQKNGIRITGFIGNQNFFKPNRTYQSLFVNGRYVINQTVSGAITNAYQSYLMKRQYPFYVLSLELPPEIVDVNVHPNKADVRFADNQIIYGTVYSVVSSVLDGSSKALEFLANKPENAPIAVEKAQEVPEIPVSREVQSAPAQSTMSYEEAKKELQFVIPPVGKNLPHFERTAKTTFDVHASGAPVEEATPKTDDYFEQNRQFLLEKEEKAVKQDRIDTSQLVYKGELFRTYLIYEAGNDAYFVDQHAAHERLLYEKLTARLNNRETASQPMLLPYILDVNAQEYAFLEKNLKSFIELGFEIEDFGGMSFKVSALPVDLMGINLKSFFEEVLASIDSLRVIKLSEIFKDRLATMACKAAVKGGEPLTEDEVRVLIEEMDGDMGLKCPHGRPACVKMKKTELEKLFKRIV